MNKAVTIFLGCAGVCLMILTLASCKKDHSVDSKTDTPVHEVEWAKLYPGRNRVRIGWGQADSYATKVKVYWRNGVVESDLQQDSPVDSLTIEGLAQGLYTFTIYAYSSKGDSSAGVTLKGLVYGEDYERTLDNRPVSKAGSLYGLLKIKWGEAPVKAIGTEVRYKNASGGLLSEIISADSDSNVFRHAAHQDSIYWRTLYLPDPAAIDTFYTAYAAVPVSPLFYSPVTQRIFDNTSLIDSVYADTVFQVGPGVRETDISYLGQRGPMKVFILEVNAKEPGISIEAVLADENIQASPASWKTVPQMAKSADAPGHNVVAAVNGDLYEVWDPYEAYGVIVKDGAVLKDIWYTDAISTQPYFAILSDGTPHIGDAGDFDLKKDKIKDALGGGWTLLRDNVLKPIGDTYFSPRTGVGTTADGYVYFVVADGRMADYSNGLRLSQLGEMLKACGSRDAISLDGGGSSTFVIRQPDGGDGWTVRNRPSDGPLRPVGNAWLIVSRSP